MKAEALYTRSIALTRQELVNDDKYTAAIKLLLARYYGALGNVFYARGDLEMAKECFFDALEVDIFLDRRERKQVMAFQFERIGDIWFQSDVFDKAENAYIEARMLAKSRKSWSDQVRLFNKVADARYARGHLDEAVDI